MWRMQDEMHGVQMVRDTGKATRPREDQGTVSLVSRDCFFQLRRTQEIGDGNVEGVGEFFDVVDGDI